MQANNVHFLVIIERLFSPRLWISKVHFAVTIETRSQLHSSKVLIPMDLKSENRISCNVFSCLPNKVLARTCSLDRRENNLLDF